MPTKSPRFVEGGRAYIEYVDTNAPVGSELRIYTIAAENLNYFIDVAGAGLEPKTAQDVSVAKSQSKGGNASVHRYPNDPNPYTRSNVEKTIMKNRSIRHGSGLPGRRFVLSEIGGDEESRQFTYVGPLFALHSLLVGHLKKDVTFTNYNGASEIIGSASAQEQ